MADHLINRKMFIPIVMNRTSCMRHGVPRGIPCYHIKLASNPFGYSPGICNQRAHDAGFVGIPTKEALSSTSKKKR